MKPFVTILGLVAFVCSSTAAQGRTLKDINIIPTRVLQRSISPKFYKTLLVSPVQGSVVVRANLAGTRLSGARVVHSDLKGLFDPLALQLAKEAKIAGNYTLDRLNGTASVLLHLLVYQIADGTMVLSFAHIDEAGGDQMDYYGCARLLILKNDKWTEIKGPESLAGKGWAVRQNNKNNVDAALKLEIRNAAETVNMHIHREHDSY